MLTIQLSPITCMLCHQLSPDFAGLYFFCMQET